MWRTTWQSFPHSQPTFLHFIIPSWQLTVPMHQIGSLICNEHDKFMVKMTILFLLWQVTVSLKLAAINSESLILPVMWVIKSPQFSHAGVWGPGGCVMWKWALRASPYISRKIGPRPPYYTERIGTWGPPFEYGCPLVIMTIPCVADHNHIIWGSPALLTISPVGDSLYGRSSITNQFLTWAFLYNIVW